MTIFADKDVKVPILYLALYRSYRAHREAGGTSSNYDLHSKRILDFKEAQPYAIDYFRAAIEPHIGENFSICVVPSHDSNKGPGPLHALAGALSGKKGRTDASSCLVRHRTIEKLATGGNRAKEVHLSSIRVEHGQLIKGKDVLLLDDVMTSGGSLEACIELLRTAGAKEVRAFCLGRTA